MRPQWHVDLTKLFTWISIRSALPLALCDSSASGFQVLPRKLWLVYTGTTDNSSMALKVVSKTGIQNSTVCFDHILNAE